MLPNANGAAVTLLGADVGGPRAGDDQLHRRRRQRPAPPAAPRRSPPSSPRAPSSRRPASTRWSPRSRATCTIVYLEDVRPTITLVRQAARPARLQEAAGRAQARRPGRDPVHLRLGGHAEGRRAVPPQHAGQCRAGGGAHRLRPQRQGVQRAAGVPLVRADGRPDPAAGLRRARLSLSLAAALPHRAGADLRHQRHHPVRHRHVPRRLCARRRTPTISARCATSSPAPSR